MKQLRIVTAVCAFSLSIAQVNAEDQFLVHEGRAYAEIIISESPARSTRLAAAELQTYVAKISGGFFWINGTERFPIPKDAYYMAGAGGQYTIIIPSHGLVVVRMGHYKGSDVGFESLCKSLALLMQTIPEHRGK